LNTGRNPCWASLPLLHHRVFLLHRKYTQKDMFLFLQENTLLRFIQQHDVWLIHSLCSKEIKMVYRKTKILYRIGKAMGKTPVNKEKIFFLNDLFLSILTMKYHQYAQVTNNTT